MFVQQKQEDGENAERGYLSQAEREEQANEKSNHDEMEKTGDPKGAGYPEVARHRMKTGVAVEVVILAGIENVESGNPKRYGSRKKENARIEQAANRDPCLPGLRLRPQRRSSFC